MLIKGSFYYNYSYPPFPMWFAVTHNNACYKNLLTFTKEVNV